MKTKIILFYLLNLTLNYQLYSQDNAATQVFKNTTLVEIILAKVKEANKNTNLECQMRSLKYLSGLNLEFNYFIAKDEFFLKEKSLSVTHILKAIEDETTPLYIPIFINDWLNLMENYIITHSDFYRPILENNKDVLIKHFQYEAITYISLIHIYTTKMLNREMDGLWRFVDRAHYNHRGCSYTISLDEKLKNGLNNQAEQSVGHSVISLLKEQAIYTWNDNVEFLNYLSYLNEKMNLELVLNYSNNHLEANKVGPIGYCLAESFFYKNMQTLFFNHEPINLFHHLKEAISDSDINELPKEIKDFLKSIEDKINRL